MLKIYPKAYIKKRYSHWMVDMLAPLFKLWLKPYHLNNTVSILSVYATEISPVGASCSGLRNCEYSFRQILIDRTTKLKWVHVYHYWRATSSGGHEIKIFHVMSQNVTLFSLNRA